MANELHLSHPLVSSLYMGLQLLVSVGFVFACPWLASASGLSLVLVHWLYLLLALLLLAVGYVAFKKKYYWMHETYLRGLGKCTKSRERPCRKGGK